MPRFGYFLTAEDHTPAELVEQAVLAQEVLPELKRRHAASSATPR